MDSWVVSLDGSLNLEKRSVQLNGCLSFQKAVLQVGSRSEAYRVGALRIFIY